MIRFGYLTKCEFWENENLRDCTLSFCNDQVLSTNGGVRTNWCELEVESVHFSTREYFKEVLL